MSDDEIRALMRESGLLFSAEVEGQQQWMSLQPMEFYRHFVRLIEQVGGQAMHCAVCLVKKRESKTEILDTRKFKVSPVEEGINRRRRCLSCGFTFWSVERALLEWPSETPEEVDVDLRMANDVHGA